MTRGPGLGPLELRPMPTKPLAPRALSRPQAVDTARPVCHQQGTDLIQAPDVCDLVVGGGRWRVGVGVQWGVRRLHGVAWGFGAALQAQLQARETGLLGLEEAESSPLPAGGL